MQQDKPYMPSLCETAPVGLIRTDAVGVIVEINAFMCRTLGSAEPGHVIGRTIHDILAPASRLFFDTQLAQLIHLNGGFTEVALQIAEGESADVLASATRYGTEVSYAFFPASARNSRERDLATVRALSETKNKLLTQIEDMVSIGAWTIELATMTPTWSDAVFAIHGIPVGEPPNLDTALQCYPEGARQEVVARIERARSTGEPFDFECEFTTMKGEMRWVRSMAEIEYFAGKPVRLVGVLQDVTEQHLAKEKLWRLAHFDPMTGLANRTLFHKVLEDELQHVSERGGSMSLLLLDLDGFKEINDAMGHDAGDSVLKAVARRISGIQGSRLCGRLGGDEFVILLGGVDHDEALLFTEKVLQKVRAPVTIGSSECSVEVSIGLVTCPLNGHDAGTLLKRADLALYDAKNTGKGRAACFDDRLEADFDRKQMQLALVRQAVVDGALKPYYQPKVDVATGTVVGFEALARIERCDEKVLSPAEFGTALEDDRGALLIHDAILDGILQDLRTWLDDGMDPGVISFNLAEPALREPGFPMNFIARLGKARVPTSRLMIEITETVFLGRDPDRVKAVLSELCAAGCEIALDDFGTGFASLSHLRDFPIDWIKIDKSFILGLREKPENEAIVTAIIGLAGNLGMKVVAEGVEKEMHLHFLQNAGCDSAQGFLFSKAKPAAEVGKMLRGHYSTAGHRLPAA